MGDRPVSLQELTARASKFATDWADATDEFRDTTQFWTEFFAMFGVSARRSGTFQAPATRSSTGNTGFMDYFWPSKIAVEQKSAGKDLNVAFEQLNDYLTGGDIPDHNLPQLAVACDFQHWLVHNLDTGEEHRFTLSELPDHIALFGFLGGYTKLRFGTDEAEANAAAAELLGRIHDELVEANYTGSDLDVLLVRILFLLFADDTSVWDDGPGLFAAWIDTRTNEDGSDLGDHLLKWFDMLRRPKDERPPNLPPDLAAVPYVNGGLFADDIGMPYCNADIRTRLLEACRFDWSTISPAVFGAMFQTVMDPEARREIGAHYTTAENIHRLIDPLFLNELREELEACGNGKSRQSRDKLKTLHAKLASMHFLDPACGCGNFLIITYRELRRIEQAILERLQLTEDQVLDINQFRKVSLTQFHGIEIKPFPATIAQTAMWLAEHKANVELGEAIGHYVKSFPLEDRANIRCDNALTLAWTDLLPADECSIVFGNPPFVGRGMIDKERRKELEAVWGTQLNSNIDYVTGWFAKTIGYLRDNPRARWGFVATNSISQGEAVPIVWRAILDEGWRCRFAQRSLKWTSDAKGTAAVRVSITGFDKETTPEPTIHSYDNPEGTLQTASNISPYLFDGPNIIVEAARRPLSVDLPEIAFGSMARDGGALIVESADIETFRLDPVANGYLRPFLGARQLLHNEERWCLWMEELRPGDASRSDLLRDRLDAVREFRLTSKAQSTRDAAETPHLFVQRAQPNTNYLAIPRVSSENRKFLAAAFCGPEVICSDALFSAPDPDGVAFALVSSTMFMTWQQTIGGRLEERIRFSKNLTYNTFPAPELTGDTRTALSDAGRAVLAARATYPDATLAELYDPVAMPVELTKAHQSLDHIVDALFGLNPNSDNAERLHVLLEAYEDAIRS